MILDYRAAGLSDADRRLCDFAVKLTVDPAASGPSDIDELRTAGFTAPEILIATQVIGYFNYINRIADGLGVEPEPWMTDQPEQWRQIKANLKAEFRRS